MRKYFGIENSEQSAIQVLPFWLCRFFIFFYILPISFYFVLNWKGEMFRSDRMVPIEYVRWFVVIANVHSHGLSWSNIAFFFASIRSLNFVPIDINFMCDWMLCVPHRYYYCFPINVGESNQFLFVIRTTPRTFRAHFPFPLFLTQNNAIWIILCTFRFEYGCMCVCALVANVTQLLWMHTLHGYESSTAKIIGEFSGIDSYLNKKNG